VLTTVGRVLSARWRDHPVFVVGAARSGTSVMKRALGQHPAVVACDGESPSVAEIASAWAPFLLDGEREYFVESVRLTPRELKSRIRSLCLDSAVGRSSGIRLQTRAAVREKKWPTSIERWCAKTFPTKDSFECLIDLYPDARFVYITRRGDDVVASRMRFPHFDMSFEEQCEAWVSTVMKYTYIDAQPQVISVRHEELVADPSVLDRVVAFVGLSPSDKPRTYVSSTLVHPLDEPTQAAVDVRKVLTDRPHAITTWDASQREVFVKICGDAMTMLGYDLDS
jgi:hypothetical protein